MLPDGSYAGIQITSIVQPEIGAVMILHCPKCRQSEIVVSEYACKPKRGLGDYWVVRNMCPLHSVVTENTEFPMFVDGRNSDSDS